LGFQHLPHTVPDSRTFPARLSSSLDSRTLASSFTSVRLFLDFYGKSSKREIEEIERVELEGFIEHEQDRGLGISTVRTRLACIIAPYYLMFFHW
jgi:hypothetical protein